MLWGRGIEGRKRDRKRMTLDVEEINLFYGNERFF